MRRSHAKANALRRKARALHRKADALLSLRRVFDATKARHKAHALDRQAAALADTQDQIEEAELWA